MTNKYNSISLIIILLLSGFIYSQGINGPFLYDDISNLSSLAQINENITTQTIKDYVLGNSSGPLGRPVAMASFLINAQSWPVEPAAFKITNIIIHLFCGLLVYIFVKKLILLIERSIDNKQASLIALISTSFWILHPLHVSTTLYVIQRMTQLSTLFSLLTFITFFRYHSLLARSHQVISFVWPTILLTLLISLAVLSKENALLIFPLLYLINHFSNQEETTITYKKWFYTLTLLPIILCIYFLISNNYGHASIYEYKGFTLVERLLSESRVVSHYLLQIIFPDTSFMTIFHDDFKISHSLTSPITTALSLIFLLGLLSLTLIKIRPLYKFAILWFFLWHLLESTILPLDLYFEHRNYIASLGPLLALAYGIFHLAEKIPSSKIQNYPVLIAVIISGLLTIQLAIVAKLWSDEETLLMHWLTNHEKSKNTLITLVQFYEKNNNLPLAHKITTKATGYEYYRDDLGIQLKLYTQQCILKKQNQQILEKLLQLTLNPEAYTHSIISITTSVVLNILNAKCKPDDIQSLHQVLHQIENNAPQISSKTWLREIQSKHAFLYLHYNNLHQALILFKKAYTYKNPDIALAIIDLNIKLSNFTEAQDWINVAQGVNKQKRVGIVDKTVELQILQSRLEEKMQSE